MPRAFHLSLAHGNALFPEVSGSGAVAGDLGTGKTDSSVESPRECVPGTTCTHACVLLCVLYPCPGFCVHPPATRIHNSSITTGKVSGLVALLRMRKQQQMFAFSSSGSCERLEKALKSVAWVWLLLDLLNLLTLEESCSDFSEGHLESQRENATSPIPTPALNAHG